VARERLKEIERAAEEWPPDRSTASLEPLQRGSARLALLLGRYGAGVPVAVKTTVTELPDSRVRLQVQVPSSAGGTARAQGDSAGARAQAPGLPRARCRPWLSRESAVRRCSRKPCARRCRVGTRRDRDRRLVRWAIRSGLGDLPPQGRRSSSRSRSEFCRRPSWLLPASRSPAASQRSREQIQQEVDATRERLARLQTAERPAPAETSWSSTTRARS